MNSLRDLCTKGWDIEIYDKGEEHNKIRDCEGIVLSVFGSKNKGKS